MQNLYVSHQKLCFPRHSHHLPPTRILYHLLLRPVISHLLWFLWTSPHLSAPEHQLAGFCPPEFQQYVILSVSPFLVACIKVMDVFEMLQTSPIPLCSGPLVHCAPLSPSLQMFNQRQRRQTKPSWARLCVCCEPRFLVSLAI